MTQQFAAILSNEAETPDDREMNDNAKSKDANKANDAETADDAQPADVSVLFSFIITEAEGKTPAIIEAL